MATREDVTDRIRMQVDDATEEVYHRVADGDLLERPVLDALADACARDVDAYVEVPSESLRGKIHDRLPAANVAVSGRPAETSAADDHSPGRLLMVDRRTVLVSARKEALVPGNWR